ncbi:hypothetical protein [Arthrobacter sp. Soil762]|uniref:hypothetical protein n=1 Tax=Arthrobacter sp. Soil762 TaxID=1736401 RepID=UPI000B051D72|nr:hypothetical protein [Arthrobacter sp. Soil762]
MNNHITGELLTADLSDRTLKYMLLPFGEDNPGLTNLGKVVASKGTVDFANSIGRSVNIEHDAKRPVGKFVNIEETDAGIIATIRVAATNEGNDALVLAAEGLRTGISVELTSPVIRAGRIISATLDAAGLVTKPAFKAAQLMVMASDFGEIEAEDTQEDSSEQEVTEVVIANADAEAEIDNESETVMSENAAVPTALNAAGNSGAAKVALNAATIAQAYATKDTRLAASFEDAGLTGEENLFAALSNITSTANTANVEQSQWLGELWSGQPYTRKYAKLVNTGSLTSWKIEGWKFTTKPVVGDYAGDLAAIPSNVVVTQRFSEEAARLAGGWKLDRKYRDFGNTEFVSSFFAAAAEDYARKSDKKVLDFIVAEAPVVAGQAIPAGVSSGAARIVQGAMSMIDVATPTFAIVGLTTYREMLMTTEFDNLKFITQALGLEGGNIAGFQIIPSSDVAATAVIVGSSQAVTFYERPGTPIQVSALDISNGGEDEALFGYYALIVNDARALVNVSVPV